MPVGHTFALRVLNPSERRYSQRQIARFLGGFVHAHLLIGCEAGKGTDLFVVKVVLQNGKHERETWSPLIVGSVCYPRRELPLAAVRGLSRIETGIIWETVLDAWSLIIGSNRGDVGYLFIQLSSEKAVGWILLPSTSPHCYPIHSNHLSFPSSHSHHAPSPSGGNMDPTRRHLHL